MTEKKIITPQKAPVFQKTKQKKTFRWGCCAGCGAVFLLIVTAFLVLFFLWVRAVAKQVAKGGQSPVTLYQMARSVSPSDIGTLRRFAEKLDKGQIHFTEKQEQDVAALINRISTSQTLDRKMAEDTALMLKSIDPEDFEDTAHWTEVLSKLLPFFTILGNVSTTGRPVPTVAPGGFGGIKQ